MAYRRSRSRGRSKYSGKSFKRRSPGRRGKSKRMKRYGSARGGIRL